MSTLIFFFCFLFFSPITFAQCNEFYQFKEGSEWEMETFNAKGKLTGTNQQKVLSYVSTANSFKAKIYSALLSEKGKELMKGDLDFTCTDGTLLIDMRNFVNQEQMKAFESYEMKIESENLEIPNALTIGQTLKDGSMTITATNSPIPMNMMVEITDRKVVGKESITSAAGTFECYKITSKSTFKTKMGISITVAYDIVEWIAPKVAIVKSESYKNNKLQGYSLLTKWK